MSRYSSILLPTFFMAPLVLVSVRWSLQQQGVGVYPNKIDKQTAEDGKMNQQSPIKMQTFIK